MTSLARRAAQLAGGQPGRVGQDGGGDGAGQVLVEGGDRIDDHFRFGLFQAAGQRGGVHVGQTADQRSGPNRVECRRLGVTRRTRQPAPSTRTRAPGQARRPAADWPATAPALWRQSGPGPAPDPAPPNRRPADPWRRRAPVSAPPPPCGPPDPPPPHAPQTDPPPPREPPDPLPSVQPPGLLPPHRVAWSTATAWAAWSAGTAWSGCRIRWHPTGCLVRHPVIEHVS